MGATDRYCRRASRGRQRQQLKPAAVETNSVEDTMVAAAIWAPD
jgi:hypothetical protein